MATINNITFKFSYLRLRKLVKRIVNLKYSIKAWGLSGLQVRPSLKTFLPWALTG